MRDKTFIKISNVSITYYLLTSWYNLKIFLIKY